MYIDIELSYDIVLMYRYKTFIIKLFGSRMEETVRTMLQYKARSEQLKEEKTCLTVAYEVSQHSSHSHCHMKEPFSPHVVGMSQPHGQ
jgi:hypothetical protein